jgi:hypothetical protein
MRFLLPIYLLFSSALWSQEVSEVPQGSTEVEVVEIKNDNESQNPEPTQNFETEDEAEQLEQLKALDQSPPTIENVVVASSNHSSPPIVTAVLADDRSGVSLVEIHWRQHNTENWKTTPLTANNNGLFMTMLPIMLSKTGFDYYVVSFDAAGNGPALYASETEPKSVKASQENTRQRIQRTVYIEDKGDTVSSGWLMFNVIFCVLSSGTSVFFWADYLQIEERKAKVTNDDAYLKELTNAQVNDAFIGGVSALAGIVTLGTTSYLLTQPISE